MKIDSGLMAGSLDEIPKLAKEIEAQGFEHAVVPAGGALAIGFQRAPGEGGAFELRAGLSGAP